MTSERTVQAAIASKCERCGKEAGREPHSCPYKSEINDDSETLCTCCWDCQVECSDNI